MNAQRCLDFSVKSLAFLCIYCTTLRGGNLEERSKCDLNVRSDGLPLQNNESRVEFNSVG